MPKRILALIIVLYSFPSITYSMPYYVSLGAFYESVSYQDSGFEGISPHISVGINNYDNPANGWFAYAGELFVNPVFIKTHRSKEDLFNLTTKRSYGASVLPGVLLDRDLLVYVRLGVVSTSFVHYSCKTGYQGGVGMEFQYERAWKIRGEYIYTSYKKLDSECLKSDGYLVSLVYQIC